MGAFTPRCLLQQANRGPKEIGFNFFAIIQSLPAAPIMGDPTRIEIQKRSKIVWLGAWPPAVAPVMQKDEATYISTILQFHTHEHNAIFRSYRPRGKLHMQMFFQWTYQLMVIARAHDQKWVLVHICVPVVVSICWMQTNTDSLCLFLWIIQHH